VEGIPGGTACDSRDGRGAVRRTRQTFAKGKTGRKFGMNKTEAAYAQELDLRKRAGLIEWFMFEGIKLRLADKTFYTVDFFVMLSDGTLQAHEVKGRWEDAARVKIKVAASLYPIQFFAITKRAKKYGGGWTYEDFEERDA
jgi:hypothetical protein